MNRWAVLAIAVAVLIAAIVKLAPMMSISPLVTMVAFAVYFGSGGGVQGLIKSGASMLAGVIWMVIANTIVVGHQEALENYRWIFFGIVALIVVLESRVSILSYFAAGLAGMAVAGGTPGFRPYGFIVMVAVVLGTVLAFVADLVAGGSRARSTAGAGVPAD